MTFDTSDEHYGGSAMPAARAPSPVARGDVTRAALLDAAHDLLATEGPGALTVRGIAAAAGVSTMNVYSRFGGKDGVLDELFVDGFRQMAGKLQEVRSSDDALGDLRRCGACYREFALENPTYYSLMFERVVPDFEPSQEAHDVALATLGQLAAHIERAMEQGSLRRDDPLTVASALWACQHGVVSLEMLMRGSDHDKGFDWDVIASLAVNALLDGLATRA